MDIVRLEQELAVDPSRIADGFLIRMNPHFIRFEHLGGAAPGPGTLTGWKFHLSVDPQDLPRAAAILKEEVARGGAGTFKLARPHLAAGDFNRPDHPQAGKMLTLYDTGEGAAYWLAMLQRVETRFRTHNIRAGHPVAGDRPLPQSRYIHYRYDGGGLYISARQAQEHAPERPYNPLGLPDPFADGLPDARARMAQRSTPAGRGGAR